MKRGFFIPADIWENQGLTLQEKVILAEIVSFTKNGKECYISNARVAEILGLKERQAREIFYGLVDRHIVKVSRFDGKNRYVEVVEGWQGSATQGGGRVPRRVAKKCQVDRQKSATQGGGRVPHTISTDTTYPSILESTNRNLHNDAKDFVPPTVAQVYDYVKDKGMKDPMGFAYYYVKTQTANGWTRRQGNKLVPVLNWKNNVNQWMPNHMNHVFPKPEIQQTPTFAERVYGPSDLSEITTLVPLDVEKHIRAGGWARFTNNTWTKI